MITSLIFTKKIMFGLNINLLSPNCKWWNLKRVLLQRVLSLCAKEHLSLIPKSNHFQGHYNKTSTYKTYKALVLIHSKSQKEPNSQNVRISLNLKRTENNIRKMHTISLLIRTLMSMKLLIRRLRNSKNSLVDNQELFQIQKRH